MSLVCNLHLWMNTNAICVPTTKAVLPETPEEKYEVLVAHHSKIQKDGWTKHIPNFAFKWC